MAGPPTFGRPSPKAIERELLRRAVATELARRLRDDLPDLPDFIAARMRGYVDPYWLAPVVDVWRRIAEGDEVRAVIEVPPRHGKTDLTLAGLAWYLAQRPDLTSAFTTYADALARSKSRKARRMAREAGIPISDESASVNEWRTTLDGGMLATGVGGPLTGHGITGVGVIDDPFKNRAEADSRLIRERVWEWYTDTFYTRLEPGASVIVQHTRWHPDDLIGRLLDDKHDDGITWERIRLPALAEDPDDPLGRAEGEALWPDRYPVDRLTRIRATVGEYTWASLYQQRPRPRGETVFQPPTFYDPDSVGIRQLLATGYRLVAGMDTAYSGKSKADASAVIQAKVVLDPIDGLPLILIDEVIHHRERVTDFGPRLRGIRAPYIRWRLYGAEAGTADLLEDQYGVRITRDTVKADKFAYAQPVAAAWNAGRVRLPQRGDEPPSAAVMALIHETRDFTGEDDPHDDLVDALASMYAEASETYPSDAAGQALTGH